jgi:hypothetical protein
MEILESLEVRWFFRGRPSPALVLHWFGDIQSEGERTDWYLRSKRVDLGFKARLKAGDSAKAETKILLGSLGVTELAPGVRGAVERWQKLSLSVDDPELRKHGAWVAVKKDRLLKRYAWQDGRVSTVPNQLRLDAGAGFELTLLSGDPVVEGYTVGVEAFGPSTELLSILERTCSAAFTDASEAGLTAEASMSYPEWLSKLPARAAQ